MTSLPPAPTAPDAPRPFRTMRTTHWIIIALLAVIAAGLWFRPTGGLLPAAMAQSQNLAGARGIFAFTGQLDRDQYGLFMLDVDQGTVWCYAFENQGGAPKLRLVAARTWLYDRYLQDFNSAAPDFRMVQKLVSQQRAKTTGAAQSGEPGADPKLDTEPPKTPGPGGG